MKQVKPGFKQNKRQFAKGEKPQGKAPWHRYDAAKKAAKPSGQHGRDKDKKGGQGVPAQHGRDRANKAAPPPLQPSMLSHGGVLVWGVHAVKEAWLNPKRRCFKLCLTEGSRAAMEGVLGEARKKGLVRPDPISVERGELDQLLPPNSVHQGVVVEVASLPDVQLHEVLESELVVVLDQVTDPHNVGAILRSAAAFGAGAVIGTERNAPNATGVLAKAASGALEHVPLVQVVNLSRAIAELQKAGFWCVGLAEEGKHDLGEVDLSGKTALIFGAEGEGLRRLTREHCDELVRLPTEGPIGSLNVSNAVCTALYEAKRQKA